MKLYNTLTKSVDEIVPIAPPQINVYTCGPTVYDYAHIGHWFNYVRMDTLIRTLKSNDFKINWVMNVTDVGHLVSDADDGEDKLEKGARREGKTAWEIADYYTKDFFECMELLGITKPNKIVKATDHIKEQIALINTLESKGYTYTISDGVYYDTSKFAGYAAFASLDLEDQQAGARVQFNPEKRNSSDFALWKFSPRGHQRDMEWDSPWGKGFPGWHIECSAMSMKYLGDTLDIHTGGIDHIPVHHTNEIAQSEAATGKRFANLWMHSNHLMVEGEKISKSLANGVRLQEVLDKGFPSEAIRLYIHESHYRTNAQFSWSGLQAATNRLKDYQAAAALRWQLKDTKPVNLDKYLTTIVGCMNDDLNTPKALAELSAWSTYVSENLLADSDSEQFKDFLARIDELLGLNLLGVEDISDSQKQLIRDREHARRQNQWDEADNIRNELKEQSIELRDTEHGTIWFRS